MPARLPQVDGSARRAASACYRRRRMRLTAGRGAELPAPPLLQVIRSPLPPRAEPAAQRPLPAAPRSYACTARAVNEGSMTGCKIVVSRRAAIARAKGAAEGHQCRRVLCTSERLRGPHFIPVGVETRPPTERGV